MLVALVTSAAGAWAGAAAMAALCLGSMFVRLSAPAGECGAIFISQARWAAASRVQATARGMLSRKHSAALACTIAQLRLRTHPSVGHTVKPSVMPGEACIAPLEASHSHQSTRPAESDRPTIATKDSVQASSGRAAAGGPSGSLAARSHRT